MKVFVVFGSQSDENVAKPLVDALSADFDVEYEVISAHRNHERLQAVMTTWQGDAVVAGAGLAAALPGVVAAMTALPVFGVPVAAQYAGVDAFASIAQMPPGVPVITSAPDDAAGIVAFLRAYKNSPRFERVHFVAPDKNILEHADLQAELEKAKKAATDKGLVLSAGTAADAGAFNIYIVTSANDVKKDAFGIHMPFVPKSETRAAAGYLPVFALADQGGGLWVGVNNARNAVHAAARLKG